MFIKKTIKILLMLTFFPVVAQVLVSCCNCSEPTVYKRFSFDAISVLQIDNSNAEAMYGSFDTVGRRAYGINVSISRRLIVQQSIPKYNFLTSAVAFSCECPPTLEIQPKDSIIAMQVFTQSDFSAEYRAGTDISDLFKVYKEKKYIALLDYLKDINAAIYNEADLVFLCDILLMQAPENTDWYQFQLVFTLSDGRELTIETNPVYLL